jgi:hypothetical protein
MTVFACSQVLAEERNAVFVAGDGLWENDIDVEHMPHIRIVLRAIAFPCSINSFFREEVIHGLGTGAEEILAGSGDIGWRVTAGDGLHDPEAGIVIGKPLA